MSLSGAFNDGNNFNKMKSSYYLYSTSNFIEKDRKRERLKYK